MAKETKNNLLSFLVGYLKHLFLSQSIFIGLFLFFLPILYLSNRFSGFSQIAAKILEVYGEIFSIDNPAEFFRVTIGIISTAFPLASYFLSKLFKSGSANGVITIKIKAFAIFYLILVLINTLVIYLFDERFSIFVFFILIFISLGSLGTYVMSLVCDYIRSKIAISGE